ncbi:piggyBac transposable element-derived protein 4-like [Centruroides vittatus]|uniref:piggyBac transposable element-derived protein 4-like n=1 Tax=Centruroides vittatus TaxID=120091 RepID=UPI00350FD9A0
MSDSEFDIEELSMSESESDSCISIDEDGLSDHSEDGSDHSDDGVDTSIRKWVEINKDDPPPPPPRFPFRGSSGCNFTLADYFDPLAYFLLFFNLELINMIVTETNNFALQQARSSRDQWEPVTVEEIYIFLTISILQGLLYKPSEKMYWSRNKLIETPIFGKLMKRTRYEEIKKNLHFENNTNFNPETHDNPKLWKIWPIINNLNSKFSQYYTPQQNISIDESLLLFKGRLSWKQYIPQKRSRYGVKFFMLCESETGYLHNFLIYTGKGTCLNKKYGHFLFTSQVVLSLLDPLLDKGYCLTTDNYYTSPQLADYLITRKTDCCGTLRTTRKDVPKILHKKKLKKGETVAMQRGKVLIQKWHDRRTVTFLSTFHSATMVSTETRTGNVLMKPQVVVHYNKTMGGVDLLDQHLHDYTVARKRGKKYYKKIFFQLLDISLYNAYVLYKKNGGQKPNMLFRLTLIERLITTYHTVTMASKHGRTRTAGPLRLTEKHFPDFIPPTDKKVAPTRCCVVCCKKNKDGKKIRRETRYQCEQCQVAMCPAPCFKIYHTKENF